MLKYLSYTVIELLLFLILWNVPGGDIIFIGSVWLFVFYSFISAIIRKNDRLNKLILAVLILLLAYGLIFRGNQILENRSIQETVEVSRES